MSRFSPEATQWHEDLEYHGWQQRRYGGQHTNGPDGGVLVVHKPTGISILKVEGRSQYTNKIAAVEQLRSILELLFP